MGKRKTSFLRRFLLLFWWLVKSNDHLVEYCHYCHTTRISRLVCNETENTFEASYRCLKCGAIARVKENWTR